MAWIRVKVYGFLSRVTLSSGTPMPSSFSQEQRMRICVGGLQQSSRRSTLSQVALLVENKRVNSSSPGLFVVPVVQSFMQQQNRISQEIRKQVRLLCCEYVLAHACRLDDPTFADNSKTLAAEDTNIKSILFSSSPAQLTVPSLKSMEALIVF